MNSYQKQIENLYLGILNNYSTFLGGKKANLIYDFRAKEFEELICKYSLKSIAKNGTSFERAKRLLHYFAPRLKHNSFYDNHIECNSLKLLEYSFENSENGINCLNKAKIITECCLALGIYARRVFINPFSPFDFDSHVVCEIFDEKLNKWVMLDPTTDGYFIDENFMPLSMIEIRNNFLLSRFQTFVSSNGKSKNLEKIKQKNDNINLYMLKNCFRISFEKYNGFGKNNGSICLIPKNYSIYKNECLNHKFRIENMPQEYLHLLKAQEKYLEETNHKKEPIAYSIKSLYESPIK